MPLLVTSYLLRGRVVVPPASLEPRANRGGADSEKKLMFGLGIGCLVAVPVFKTVTHLPPFMGMLFGLGILWLVGEIVHRGKTRGRQGRA